MDGKKRERASRNEGVLAEFGRKAIGKATGQRAQVCLSYQKQVKRE
jgi:hypothetical protein